MDTTSVSPRFDRMLSASAIFNRPASPVPSSSSRAVLASAIATLPMFVNNVEANIVEQLALALVDRDEVLQVTRELLMQAFALSHHQHVVIGRLQQRLAGIRDARQQQPQPQRQQQGKGRTTEALKKNTNPNKNTNTNSNTNTNTNTNRNSKATARMRPPAQDENGYEQTCAALAEQR